MLLLRYRDVLHYSASLCGSTTYRIRGQGILEEDTDGRNNSRDAVTSFFYSMPTFPLVYNFRLDVFSLFVNVEWSTLRRIDVLKGHDRMMMSV